MNYLLKAISLGAVMAAGLAIAEPSGTFRQAHDYGFGEKSSLDPSSPGRIQWITEKIMNRLVSPDLAGIPEADLATEWSANAEATEWTFKLREGVTFHNGSTLDAADVIYTFERILDPDGTSPARSALKMIESVSAVDDMTVKMTLNTPFADMPLQLMDYRMRIIPDGSGDMIGETGIGTGPFKVEKYEADGTTVLVANLDYYKGAPKLARMEIIAISEGQARIQAFLGGQTDMYRYVTAQERVLLDRSDKYNVQVIPTGNWRGLVFRTDVEPFTDARVRKAVRLAADRQEIVDLVYGGGAVVACDTPVEPNDQYRADLKCPQDIAQAKALLAEAGYPNGIDVDVHVSTLEPSWSNLAVVYQEQAAKAGIRVNVVQAPSDGYWNAIWMNKTVSATRWNERPADQALHEIYLSSAKWNESFYKDEGFDALLATARRELDFDKRKALYAKAQTHLWETAGTLIPIHVTKIVGVNARVKNVDAVKREAIRWHLIEVD